MTENELAEKNAQFAKGVMELAFRMGYVTRDDELIRCKDCKHSLHNQFTGDWYCWLYNIAREIESDGFCYKAERKKE